MGAGGVVGAGLVVGRGAGAELVVRGMGLVVGGAGAAVVGAEVVVVESGLTDDEVSSNDIATAAVVVSGDELTITEEEDAKRVECSTMSVVSISSMVVSCSTLAVV